MRGEGEGRERKGREGGREGERGGRVWVLTNKESCQSSFVVPMSSPLLEAEEHV